MQAHMLKDAIILGVIGLTIYDAIMDRTIINRSSPPIKLAMAQSFPAKIFILAAGVVRVNFMVSSANSPPNISILIKVVNSGIRVYDKTCKTKTESSALPITLMPVKLFIT